MDGWMEVAVVVVAVEGTPVRDAGGGKDGIRETFFADGYNLWFMIDVFFVCVSVCR